MSAALTVPLLTNASSPKYPHYTDSWHSIWGFTWVGNLIQSPSDSTTTSLDLPVPKNPSQTPDSPQSSSLLGADNILPRSPTHTQPLPVEDLVKTQFSPSVTRILILSILTSLIDYTSTFTLYGSLVAAKNLPEHSQTFFSSDKLRLTVWVVSLALTKLLATKVKQVTSFRSVLLAQYIQKSLSVVVHHRLGEMARTETTALNKFSLGEVISLVQLDVAKIANAHSLYVKTILVPVELVISTAGLWWLMGYSFIPALPIVVLLMYGHALLGRIFLKFQTKSMGAKDNSGRLIYETFSNIRFIQNQVLELNFIRRLLDVKEEELTWQGKKIYRLLASTALNVAGPLLALSLVYTTHLLLTKTLQIEQAFVTGVLFATFLANTKTAGILFSSKAELKVSADRLDLFLSQAISANKDTDNQTSSNSNNSVRMTHETTQKGYVLTVNGRFRWTDSLHAEFLAVKEKVFGSKKKQKNKEKNAKANPSMKSSIIDTDGGQAKEEICKPGFELTVSGLTMRQGDFIGVFGRIGAGKTSLLRALLAVLSQCGQLSVGYATQEPWIFAGTLLDNLTFGHSADLERANQVLSACCLLEEVELMKDGLQTLLGDKGINLSGGQKARLSLARVLYAKPDIVLLDDPFSALDVRVKSHVMQNAVLGFLQNTTRIVVTHAVDLMYHFDRIWIIQEAKIYFDGGYQEYLAKQESQMDLQEPNSAENQTTELSISGPGSGKKQKQSSDQNKHATSEPSVETGKVLEQLGLEEKNSTGSLKLGLLHRYLQLAGGYCPRGVFAFLTVVIGLSLNFGFNFFLQYWATGITRDPSAFDDVTGFASVLVLTSLASGLAEVVRIYIFQKGNLQMSKALNMLMVFRLMHASTTKFFDLVPIGRLLNRFLKDTETVDKLLGRQVAVFFLLVFTCFQDCLVLVFAGSTLISVPLIGVYVWIAWRWQQKYQNFRSRLTQQAAVHTNPVLQSFTELHRGGVTIAAFGQSSQWTHKFTASYDDLLKDQIMLEGAKAWFATRLATLANLVVVPCLLLAVFVGQSSVGVFALLLKYISVAVSNIDALLETSSALENMMVSFERCLALGKVPFATGYKDLASRRRIIGNRSVEDNKSIRAEADHMTEIPCDLAIEAQNLSVRYRTGLDLVLKGVSLQIRASSKVGVIGRTGSGKSTLVNTILGHVEEYSGSLKIYGAELRNTNVSDIRSQITVVSQEVNLFKNTVRFNLDPSDSRTDEEILLILDRFGLKNLDLGSLIEEGGSNLSQGEKQLICLARACLSKTRLCILDEPTSSIDAESDKGIQEALSHFFKDSTVIVIAHRLETVMKCDHLIVFQDGSILNQGKVSDILGTSGETSLLNLDLRP